MSPFHYIIIIAPKNSMISKLTSSNGQKIFYIRNTLNTNDTAKNSTFSQINPKHYYWGYVNKIKQRFKQKLVATAFLPLLFVSSELVTGEKTK